MATSPHIVPEVSILTSCKQGITASQVMRRLTDRGHYVFDLYCLSGPDVVALQGPSYAANGTAIDSCTEHLAATKSETVKNYLYQSWNLCRQDPAHVGQPKFHTLTAQEIYEQLQSGSVARPFAEDGIRIAALASYLPNLSHPDSAIRHVAQQALLHLAQLADHLGASCVELVGGPRFKTVESKSLAAFESGHFRNRLNALAQSLYAVATDRHMPTSVGLAIEIEPGPVTLLRDLDSTMEVLAMVDQKHGRPLENVGLNMDIGHFSSIFHNEEGIPSRVRDHEVRSRVMHFHCSDLRPPHFADVPFPLWRPHQYFAKWTHYFLELLHSPDASPFLTGVMAIELEAVESLDDALLAASTLRGWIRDGVRHLRDVPCPRARLSPWPLHSRSEATVVIADLVGSTPLVTEIELQGSDISKVWASFTEHIARALHAQGGRLLQFTGDGFVGVFFPYGAEDEAKERQQDCVDRTLQFLDGVAGEVAQFAGHLKIKDWHFQGVRAGVASGPVYFGTIYPGEEEQTTVFGPTIIRAARLMALAADGGVYADDATQGAAPDRFKQRFRSYKVLLLKGLERSGKQRVWSYLGALAPSNSNQRRGKFGRPPPK